MKKAALTAYILFFFLASIEVAASNTAGYAWSESVGWFDFSNVTVTDTAILGYAYNDNTGWLVLDGVINTNGRLSGFAWSESVGYFNFNNAHIENGLIKGYAYNDNTGWLSFSTGTNVNTTWTAPVVTSRPSYGGGSSGGIYSIPLSLQDPDLAGTSTINTVLLTSILIGNKNFGINTTGVSVKSLQQFLNQQGFIVSKAGAGSPGKETFYFGRGTKNALVQFQLKNGIIPATGYFGPKTKAIIKTLLLKK